jgi:hypothetical protein
VAILVSLTRYARNRRPRGRASAALSVLSREKVGHFRLGEAQEAYTWRDGNTLIVVFSGADFYSKIAF